MEEFYLASNGAGRMHCALWEPESAPRAVVQIIHGIAEHIGRYDHFARFLTQRGFVVCADDHMGTDFLWKRAASTAIFRAAGCLRWQTNGRSMKK